MDLIFYRGLNCRLASIINIADALDVNYPDAFATLWSETDFTDEIKYNIYMSKRVFVNLEAIGVIMDTFDCDVMNTEEMMSRIAGGEWLCIGMDTFSIPWHPVSGHFHDPHYFFAKKGHKNSIECFDPVYHEKNIEIDPDDILHAAFDVSHVYKRDTHPPQRGMGQEATEVLRSHPAIMGSLLTEMRTCVNEGKSNLMRLLKQINAMINNRYLFRHYWNQSALDSDCRASFFDDAYFLKWEAVRNGLYKASVVWENECVVGEVCDLFTQLMEEEMAVAEKIIGYASDENEHRIQLLTKRF